jgi:uncharacterized damage-inducible protein DinB
MTVATDRVDPPARADEREQLFAYLDYQRTTLQLKAAGLPGDQLARALPPSTLTLGGLLKHMALVEDNWFSVFLHGNPMASPWCDVDWKADPDWEFRTAADDDPDGLREQLAGTVARSRELVSGLELDHVSVRRLRGSNEQVNLRWIVLHMIEEYARHNGHADFLRESIDGSIGE